jgi:endonuclease/exonuclease/phosphatase family metal-dependent hydrolase
LSRRARSRAFEVFGRTYHFVLQPPLAFLAERFGESFFQTRFDQSDREARDVDSDPLPLMLLRRMHRRPATAERIEDHGLVAFVRAHLDDSLKERQRLLCRITEAFFSH